MLKKILKKIVKKLRIKKILKKIAYKVYGVMASVLPIQKNIIVFESNQGRNYTGNPRYIYEELVRHGLDQKYKCYYVFKNPNVSLPGHAVTVKRNRFLYFYIMAVAGVWVSDSRLQDQLIKRKETLYIQTWHGTPLKKLALDMDDVYMAGTAGIETYKKRFYDNTQTWDCLISQNKYSTEIFRRCFAFQKQMLEIGYPRNDVLINHNQKSYIQDLKKKFGLPNDKKVILYAPTWRDDEFYGKGKYKFAVKLDFDKLREELSDDYVIIVKYHYLIMDAIDWTPYKDFIYHYDVKCDIAELYLVSDMLITDYSSVMFDYSILKRPMLFYAYDLENYMHNLRGFYFDFMNEVPGPISQTTEELIEDIRGYKEEDYMEKYNKFAEKFNHADDGHASGKVVELIMKHIKGK